MKTCKVDPCRTGFEPTYLVPGRVHFAAASALRPFRTTIACYTRCVDPYEREHRLRHEPRVRDDGDEAPGTQGIDRVADQVTCPDCIAEMTEALAADGEPR